MTKRLHAVFDGKMLCPEEPVDLELNGHYVLTIEPEEETKEISAVENDPAFNLSSLAVKTGIPDLATEHDHYLYGAPKRGSEDVRCQFRFLDCPAQPGR